jgi:5-formyltetrahydrofolate cyclo-ligase
MINKLNKHFLRKQLLNKRKFLSKRSILEKSNKIADKLIKFDKYQQSEKIMLYISTKSEVQTQRIIESAQKDNKSIYIPLIIPEQHDLIPSLVIDFEKEIALGNLGIYQPRKEFHRLFPPSILDLVIVPGLAFNQQGHRLGRGGGYYDRFLKKLPVQAYSIALAFEMQMIEQIPLEENDMPVDCIITEKRIIKLKNDKKNK